MNKCFKQKVFFVVIGLCMMMGILDIKAFSQTLTPENQLITASPQAAISVKLSGDKSSFVQGENIAVDILMYNQGYTDVSFNLSFPKDKIELSKSNRGCFTAPFYDEVENDTGIYMKLDPTGKYDNENGQVAYLFHVDDNTKNTSVIREQGKQNYIAASNTGAKVCTINFKAKTDCKLNKDDFEFLNDPVYSTAALGGNVLVKKQAIAQVVKNIIELPEIQKQSVRVRLYNELTNIYQQAYSNGVIVYLTDKNNNPIKETSYGSEYKTYEGTCTYFDLEPGTYNVTVNQQKQGPWYSNVKKELVIPDNVTDSVVDCVLKYTPSKFTIPVTPNVVTDKNDRLFYSWDYCTDSDSLGKNYEVRYSEAEKDKDGKFMIYAGTRYSNVLYFPATATECQYLNVQGFDTLWESGIRWSLRSNTNYLNFLSKSMPQYANDFKAIASNNAEAIARFSKLCSSAISYVSLWNDNNKAFSSSYRNTKYINLNVDTYQKEHVEQIKIYSRDNELANYQEIMASITEDNGVKKYTYACPFGKPLKIEIILENGYYYFNQGLSKISNDKQTIKHERLLDGRYKYTIEAIISIEDLSKYTTALSLRENAQIIPTTGTIQFSSKGGSVIEPITVELNKPVKNLEQSWYPNVNFDGWYKDEELTQRWTDDDMIDIFNTDITLYAKWASELPLNKNIDQLV